MSLKLPVVRDHHVVYILGHVFVATFLCTCDINELTVRCALEQQTCESDACATPCHANTDNLQTCLDNVKFRPVRLKILV